eukprot:NODE_14118_length_1127_cov_6.562000.p1 GENE.NODE_14118_length_1127_cov_6.562000~~NODE_14118_length_1127_cov_6.562000.p1  ORF type:complete len:305 (+),score=57.91 NODE_14118_length_1127_cov_6.562000:118-915(+)
MLIYRHMTQASDKRDPLKTFLSLILIQLLPLIFLEMRLLRAPDPLALLTDFGPKVLLMHTCFLAFRVLTQPFRTFGPGDSMTFCFNFLGLIGSLIVLHKGFNFRWNLHSVLFHYDVWALAVLAIVGGVVTEAIENVMRPKPFSKMLDHIALTSSDYIEIIAFVPAVWLITRHSKSQTGHVIPASDPRTRVVYFFAFLVLFYFAEDVVGALTLGWKMPLVAGGYIVHYIMLCDVALFLLAHIYNPEQMRGALRNAIMRWAPDKTNV